MYSLHIAKRAKTFTKTLSKRYKTSILLAYREIAEFPHMGKQLSRELSGRYVYKVGVYRIIYMINESDKVVDVLAIVRRASIYQ